MSACGTCSREPMRAGPHVLNAPLSAGMGERLPAACGQHRLRLAACRRRLSGIGFRGNDTRSHTTNSILLPHRSAGLTNGRRACARPSWPIYLAGAQLPRRAEPMPLTMFSHFVCGALGEGSARLVLRASDRRTLRPPRTRAATRPNHSARSHLMDSFCAAAAAAPPSSTPGKLRE